MEFNKSFQQQMQNYPKNNGTASFLDKMQEEVSGVAGNRSNGEGDSCLCTEDGDSLSIFPPMFLHSQFKCCGAANYTDWENIPGMGKDRVPDSCCINITARCGTDFDPHAINTQVGGRLR